MNYPYKNLDNFTTSALLERSVALYGSNIALSHVNKDPITYKELGQKVKALATLLEEHGVHKGDKVALLGENMPHWGVAYFAITSLGAVVVPILVDFHPSEINHILRHAEVKAICVSSEQFSTLEETQKEHLDFVVDLDTLELLIDYKEEHYLHQLKLKVKEKILKHKQHKNEPDEDDLCAIIYTSGTTGHSKGVMLSHKNIVTNAMSSHSILEIKPEDSFLSILPLAHTFECTVGLIVPLLHGSSVYYIEKVPTPSVLLKAFSDVRPTMMLSVPLVIEKIYKTKVFSKINSSFITRNLYKIAFLKKLIHKAAGKKLLESFGGRLRFFGVGGAALASYVEEFLYDASFPYVVGYGLTETAPLLAGTPMNKATKLGSTGEAMYGVELKIKDKNPDTGEGEICAKSPSVMLGYYKDEEKTKEVFDKDGWFLTGDLGYIDEDGYLFISGRSKNVIISASGENIYPEQIEAIINQHEAVLDSLVLQKNHQLVARIHLDYELLDKQFHGHKASDTKVKEEIQKLLEHIRVDVNSKVSSFCKMVKFIEQIEPFVKTPTKKIKRYLYTH